MTAQRRANLNHFHFFFFQFLRFSILKIRMEAPYGLSSARIFFAPRAPSMDFAKFRDILGINLKNM